MGNPFGISLPPLTSAEAQALDMRPASLKRWLASLDVQERGEATRQFYERLVLSNRIEMAPRARFEWAESLRDTLRVIMDGLRSHYQSKPFPLAAKALAVAQLANTLHEEMILAYRRVLASPPDSSLLGRSSDRQMRQVACYRLFDHAGEMLCNYQMMYLPAPPGMWRHLHSYYGRIRSQGWAGTAIAGIEAPATIEYLYRRMLLLALVPVQRIPARELGKIKGKIDTWLPLLSLSTAQQRPAARPLFCVRFELDAPVAGGVDTCCGACGHRLAGVLLDTAPLIGELEAQLKSDAKGASAAEHGAPSFETLQILLRAWHIPETPRAPRTPVDLELTVVSGLDNIHAILSAPSPSAGADGEESAAERFHLPELTLDDINRKPVLSAFPGGSFLGQREQERDVWKLSYGEEKFEALSSIWNGTASEKHVDALPARAVDASDAGYRLEMELPEKSSLRLGDLIALHGASNLGWELFLLRWIRPLEGGRAALGLERIGDGLRAVDLVVQGSDSARATLPALSALDEEVSPLLLMPTLPALSKKRLAIRDGEAEASITLADNRALSPLFESYTYHVNETVRKQLAGLHSATKREPVGEEETPFHELWTLL